MMREIVCKFFVGMTVLFFVPALLVWFVVSIPSTLFFLLLAVFDGKGNVWEDVWGLYCPWKLW